MQISLTFPEHMSYSLTVTESGGLTLGLTGPAGPAGPAGATGPAGPVATPLVRSEAPVDHSIRVTGTLEDAYGPIEFLDLIYQGLYSGLPNYMDASASSTIIYTDIWTLDFNTGQAVWTSTADVDTPLLVPLGAWNATTNPHAWKPTSPATGTPILSVVETPASFLGQIAIVSEADVYACTRLSPVKWTLLSNP